MVERLLSRLKYLTNRRQTEIENFKIQKRFDNLVYSNQVNEELKDRRREVSKKEHLFTDKT